MLLSTPIVQIMKRDPISIDVSHSILEAIQILSEGRFHHLPVVDQKRLVGILSTVDILKFNGEAFHGSEDSKPALVASRMCVGDVMVKEVIPLSERATIGDAVALLSNGDFHSVPVMAATGLLIGIVTTTDIIRHLLETPVAPELPENVRARMETIEKVYAAAQSFLASDRTALALDHLERTVQEARWAA